MAGGFTIREISLDDAVGSFKTGNVAFQALKTFLKNDAKSFHQANVAKTYVAAETCIDPDGNEVEAAPTRVLGYVTLTCSEVCLKDTYELADAHGAKNYDHLPAVKIARLAVDSRHQGKRIGVALVSLAIAIAQDEIGSWVGCRFVITDAKKDAVDFYTKQGFTILDTAENRADPTPVMFIDLQLLPPAPLF